MLYAFSFFELKLPFFWLTADCFAWLVSEREEPRNCFVFLINKYYMSRLTMHWQHFNIKVGKNLNLKV